MCLLFTCWASVVFVLAQTVYLLSKRHQRLFFIFWSNVVCVFFFLISGSFFFPYKSLCSRSEIIRSPSDLCSSSCSLISSRSDHKFIPVYWSKFTGKAKTKRNHPNLKNRSRFIEPGGRTVVRASPCFFAWNGSSP